MEKYGACSQGQENRKDIAILNVQYESLISDVKDIKHILHLMQIQNVELSGNITRGLDKIQEAKKSLKDHCEAGKPYRATVISVAFSLFVVICSSVYSYGKLNEKVRYIELKTKGV